MLSYRQQVLATCRSLRAASSGLPPLNPDLTIDRTAFLEWARGQLATSEDVLNDLWSRPVPDELKEERAGAERDARDLVDRTSSGLDELEDTLPTRFPFVQGRPAALQQFSNELAAPSTRFEASMSELAAEPCRPSPTGTGGG